MKVKIPKTKSVYGPISTSIIIKRALEANQDYLYFAGIEEDDGYILLDHEKNTHHGDFFLLQDIELYEDEKRTPENPMYTIKELEERKDLVIYLDSQEEFNKLKTITKELTAGYYGKYCYSLYEKNYSSESNKNNAKGYDDVKIITIDQIKELNMKEKEILGYKLIKPEYEQAAALITNYVIYQNQSFAKYIQETSFKNDTLHRLETKLKNVGVLDLWFEPVFKEETFKVGDWITITDTKGITGWMDDTDKRTFKIHGEKTKFHAGFFWQLKKGRGVYGEFRLATPEEIAAATHKTVKLSIGKNVDIGRDKLSNQVFIIAEGKTIQFRHINNLYCNTNTFGDTGWKIQYNTFDIGCWKNITREDLKLIIDAYEEIND